MSTPHVAGLGALLKQLQPAWSPIAIQSALLTTASDVLDSTSEAGRIFRQGAGLVGIQTVKRRLTNVSGNPATFNATLSGLAGFSAVVNPSSLVLAAGQTKEVTVTFTRTSALFNDYSGGQLSWSDGQRTARVPVVLRPVA